ncbi:MAG: glycoside hydrolase family 15 protein [Thermaerobacter sp.]|nr:glycoside hydrolase family 15 protein [Thermaerobacter sp.]
MVQTRFYGFLSNRYTSALISPDGVVEWLAFPRFDGDAVFCRLLDPIHGGFIGLRPTSQFTAAQRYRTDSLILETILDSDQGRATIHDFLAIGRSEFWRRVTTEVPLMLTCRPTFGFGYASAAYQITETGAIFTHPQGAEGIVLIIQGPAKKLVQRDQWQIGPGMVDVVVRHSPNLTQEEEIVTEPCEDGDYVERVTDQYWKHGLIPYHGPWADMFRRSLLTVRGLTYRTNGALLAAATTSLPEAVGESRQWDYRYVWVRDGAYAAESLLLAGDPVAGRQFLEFMFNTVSLVGKPFESPFYRVDGTMTRGESELLWLSGFKNSRPVRVGNAASGQLQLDIEGDLLWTLYIYWKVTHDRTFIRDYWWAIEALVDWVARNWDQPDASLWEFRGDDDRYVHSQAMCWVAMAVGAALARDALGRDGVAERWTRTADSIRHAVLDQAQSSARAMFTQGEFHRGMDAALLTLPLYGFVAADHPLFQATLEQIERDLVHDDVVLRYTFDNMGTAHWPFTLAGFWLARVYLRMGDVGRADRIIARQMQLTTDLGLFAEHVDPDTGEQHGNFPQLFPHAALIATLVERQWLVDGRPLPAL